MTDSRQRISVGGKRQDEDATFLAQLTVALGDDYRIDKLIGQADLVECTRQPMSGLAEAWPSK